MLNFSYDYNAQFFYDYYENNVDNHAAILEKLNLQRRGVCAMPVSNIASGS